MPPDQNALNRVEVFWAFTCALAWLSRYLAHASCKNEYIIAKCTHEVVVGNLASMMDYRVEVKSYDHLKLTHL